MSTEVNPDALVALRGELTGPAYLRGEDGYAEELAGFNTLSPLSPDLVVGAVDERDVQLAVRFARAAGLQVSVMATGHGSYCSVPEGVLIRTHRLDAIDVDPETRRFTIGAGARWMDILPRLAPHGLGAVTGSSPSVGAVGLTLGGGVGPLSRTFGWAADRAVSYRLVDGLGELLTVSADDHPDLFWALKGGKVGLGIVTEMTLEALPLREVYGGGIFFAEEHIEAVLRAWLPWTKTLPEAANTSIGILRLPEDVPAPLGGRTLAHLRYAYAGLELSPEDLEARGAELLAPMRAIADALVDGVGILACDRVGEIHAEPFGPLPIWERGEFLDAIDETYIETLLAHAGAGTDAPFSNVETRMFGGATHREPAAPNAIGGRGAAFSLLVIGVDVPGVTDEALRRVGTALFDDVAAYAHAEVNYNWAGHPTAQTWRRLWSPETAARLAEVRRRYDPEARFAFGDQEGSR
ncbi:FAD-binding oxidoreductase [Leucobacter triazinivorans]|uniref:FAD-binding oxidoreductase n=1 Tax=Leucobacter triazinivorans TaxID=1784719 RepID=A0A4P6KG94_9MICO|nr:FAD-binding oxidoreductase [Leucobacter triazinivorans]QBE49061.1 FAD-binding oxidoreductase [Leucobacter triazinivorans]